MTPVFQTIVDSKRGDCTRAAVASVLNLDILQVPHFILFEGEQWWYAMSWFFYGLGYEFPLCCHPEADAFGTLEQQEGFDGHFIASVPSKTFPGAGHSVVIDRNGIVVHDPNPNQLWKGENVRNTMLDWYLIRKRDGKAAETE